MTNCLFQVAVWLLLVTFVFTQRGSSVLHKIKYVRLILAEKCVESSVNDTPLLVECTGDYFGTHSTGSQFWHITKIGDYYTFRNKATQKCLGRPENMDIYLKRAEMVDCNSYMKSHWLIDQIGINSILWWDTHGQKECLKTYNDSRNFKRITLSRCTNMPSERRMFYFKP